MLLIATLGGIYLALMFGTLLWMRWRRKTRWPFKDTDKLLRSPGETLRRRLYEIDEQFVMELVGGIAGSAVAFGLAGSLARVLGPLSGSQIYWAACSAVILVQIFSVWRITRLWREYSDKFLGWYGERFAANYLRPLERRGYFVFHDVPFAGATGPYNIDHVTVGATGVAVIEVKTPRKGRARPGHKEHVVKFDGQQLIWPWGEDRRGIEQTANAARSLADWIQERTGLRITPRQILTFPSWYVEEQPGAPLRVVQTKFLESAVLGRGETILTPDQVDLIARQLELQCRDVSD